MNDTKQRLIQITRKMIDQDGVDSISLRELGKELNMSRSAMYRHFKNKEDLLAAIVAENFLSLNSKISKLIEVNGDIRKLLKDILCTYYDYGMKNKEHYHLMFQKQWDKNLYPDIYKSAFAIFGLVETCLEKAGNIKKTPNQLTAIIFAFIHGLVELNSAQHTEVEKGLDTPTNLIDSFLDLIFI